MSDEYKVTPVETKRPSLMIATPMYGGMCTGAYVQGLLFTVAKMRELGVHVAWCQITNESLITRARNELARVFLESGHDYLMFIDADIGFDANAVAMLLAGDRDIACGIYPKKEVNWDSVKKAAREGKNDLHDHAGAFVFNMVGSGDVETDPEGFIEVRHGGTGFMLIKRGVLEQMVEAYPETRYVRDMTSLKTDGSVDRTTDTQYALFDGSIDEESKRYLSEDYTFCRRWQKIGGKIWTDPEIVLNHVGSHVFRGRKLVE